MSEIINPTKKTKIKRFPKRGNFQRKTIYKILDEGFVSQVGFAVDGDPPFVLPNAYARIDDKLLIYGSAASRMMRALLTKKSTIRVALLLTSDVLRRGRVPGNFIFLKFPVFH